MIIPERITSIVFSVHLLSSLRNLFYMTEKRTIFVYTDVCWLDKTNKNLEIQCKRFCFISVGVQAVLRFLVNVKNLELTIYLIF